MDIVKRFRPIAALMTGMLLLALSACGKSDSQQEESPAVTITALIVMGVIAVTVIIMMMKDKK